MKFSEHVVTTSKPMEKHDQYYYSSDCRLSASTRVRHRVVRIIHTDADATDSSGEDDDHLDLKVVQMQRVKRHVTRINFQSPLPLEDEEEQQPKQPPPPPPRKKFRGVRQRPWGRWAAEIWDPTLRKRVWLGTHDTPEEAAAAYDKAAVRLKGPNAVTNLPCVIGESSTSVSCSLNVGAESPTSVPRYEEGESPFGVGRFSYGEEEALGCLGSGFGFDFDFDMGVKFAGHIVE